MVDGEVLTENSLPYSGFWVDVPAAEHARREIVVVVDNRFAYPATIVDALADEMEVGDALLLLVIENVWAEGLRDALRDAGLVFARQDYLNPDGLLALGAMLGLAATEAE